MPIFKTADGIELHYDDSGSGTPLVLLHGWAISSRVWREVVPHLADVFRVITVDLRGHGLSSPGNDYSLAAFSGDIAGLCTHLDLKDATLIGWSMGGQVALATAHTIGRRLAALVLVGSTPKFTAAADFPHAIPAIAARGMAFRLKRDYPKAMEDFFRSMFTEQELSREGEIAPLEGLEDFPAAVETALEALATLISTDLRALLPSIHLPVLLIHGSRDTICLPGASRFMIEQLPKATLKVIADAGHAPFLSRSGEFILLLREFLARAYGGD